ncbi:MlaE family ABC transporter permease [Actomonas aquatica]|uniref:ABC transporter permease n=1 Tax=Actomonas aquatica TaxID=2866162 RepID=A0ABZ1CE49_9BACT|nr:ABC transporter permease [Opitutus sp. WL0086]WRQ89763.1 ABC transporter permease [Opitutus sp. WL0086]
MTRFHNFFDAFGSGVLMTWRAFVSLPSAPRILKRTAEQGYLAGYTSLPIVSVLCFFIGAVLALQAGISFRDFGAKELIGALVGASMARELGPVMVAILLAGRVGSATTAELASMRVNSEIDALVTMNIPPERLLVLPRLLAVLLIMPVLTILANLIGWFGGAVVCEYVSFIGISGDQFFRALQEFLTVDDILDGIIKAEIFGFVITIIACNTGLRTRGGPREIGLAVTKSVVLSLVAILTLDYFITKVLA